MNRKLSVFYLGLILLNLFNLCNQTAAMASKKGVSSLEVGAMLLPAFSSSFLVFAVITLRGSLRHMEETTRNRETYRREIERQRQLNMALAQQIEILSTKLKKPPISQTPQENEEKVERRSVKNAIDGIEI